MLFEENNKTKSSGRINQFALRKAREIEDYEKGYDNEEHSLNNPELAVDQLPGGVPYMRRNNFSYSVFQLFLNIN